jgi:hypothetical protein
LAIGPLKFNGLLEWLQIQSSSSPPETAKPKAKPLKATEPSSKEAKIAEAEKRERERRLKAEASGTGSPVEAAEASPAEGVSEGFESDIRLGSAADPEAPAAPEPAGATDEPVETTHIREEL